MNKKKEQNDQARMKKITVNKKAFHDYEIIEKFEAGMILEGSEVKSLREGRVNLKDSYIDVKNKEAFLVGTHISTYQNASYNNHDPERVRKLLLHKQELKKLDKKVRTRGVTVIPLQIFLTPKGLFKIEIALAKGRRAYDKKEQIKDKDIRRDMDRELKGFK